MKATFKKISLLAFHKNRENLSQILQDLGVIHLEVDYQYRNESIEAIERERNQVQKVIETLENASKKESSNTRPTEALSTKQVIEKVLKLRKTTEEASPRRETLRTAYLKLEPWGSFDREKLYLLEERGIIFRFYLARKKEFRNYNFEDKLVKVIHEGPDRIYFVAISKGEPIVLPFETVELPDATLKEVKNELNSITSQQQASFEELKTYVAHLGELKTKLRHLDDDLEYKTVNGNYSSYANNKLVAITGWFPEKLEQRLTYVLNEKGVAFAIQEATKDDKVPVLLKNAKYPRLFESITKIFELPNYYEMDLTPFIAVFYPILFAYCLGDAGYGVVLLLISVSGYFTFLKEVKSGSVFGMPLTGEIAALAFLEPYVFIPDDRDFIFNAFNVSLMIGVLQIIIGIVISIVNKVRYEGLILAISQIGKLFIVTGLIWWFLADMQEMEALQPLKPVRQGMIIGGVVLVLLFHDMSLSVAKRAASGILPLFFIFTGILGDILSYVRLFALGVASSVLGLVVNQIGQQIMSNGWWGMVVGVVFLLFGHGLNFAIAFLGSFVHPLRLTFVEFYNNAQFQGGGLAYKPFRKQALNEQN